MGLSVVLNLIHPQTRSLPRASSFLKSQRTHYHSRWHDSFDDSRHSSESRSSTNLSFPLPRASPLMKPQRTQSAGSIAACNAGCRKTTVIWATGWRRDHLRAATTPLPDNGRCRRHSWAPPLLSDSGSCRSQAFDRNLAPLSWQLRRRHNDVIPSPFFKNGGLKINTGTFPS